MAGNIVGMIPKNFLIVLLENYSWYTPLQKRTESLSEMFHTSYYRRGKTDLNKDSTEFEEIDEDDISHRKRLFDRPNAAIRKLSKVYASNEKEKF